MLSKNEVRVAAGRPWSYRSGEQVGEALTQELSGSIQASFDRLLGALHCSRDRQSNPPSFRGMLRRAVADSMRQQSAYSQISFLTRAQQD